MDLDLMLGLRSHIRVGSHTPGKMKLKFGLAVIGNPKVLEYVKVNGFGPPKGQETPGITRTRFNPLTRAMTLEYDTKVIEPKLLHKLFTSKSAEDFEATALELAQTTNFDMASFCN